MTPIKKTQTNRDADNSATEVKHSFLILHNDDYNTFDFVISCLIEVCNHLPEQAEQCALITHHNGNCDIKKGSIYSLRRLKKELQTLGLTVSIQ